MAEAAQAAEVAIAQVTMMCSVCRYTLFHEGENLVVCQNSQCERHGTVYRYTPLKIVLIREHSR